MRLNAFREWRGGCQLVGSIALDGSEVSFAYDAAYLDDADAAAVSLSLPLREEPFAEAEASPFFAGLAPEGDMRRLVGDFIRSTSFAKMLERLNNESIGALVFAPDGEEPDLPGSYEPIGTGELTRFRDSPSEVSFEMGMASRLSLAGAQSKVGLYHVGDDPLEGWYVPQGAAPTTHIVKAPTRVFPNQTVNEALCLESARLCGFDAAGWELIDLPGGEPLLAVRRFDRMLPDGAWGTGELPRPQRLHQEDLCQATALMPEMKYEPTGGQPPLAMRGGGRALLRQPVRGPGLPPPVGLSRLPPGELRQPPQEPLAALGRLVAGRPALASLRPHLHDHLPGDSPGDGGLPGAVEKGGRRAREGPLACGARRGRPGAAWGPALS